MDIETAKRIESQEIIIARLTEALEHWVFLYRWRVDGMNVEQARIHASAFVREGLCREVME